MQIIINKTNLNLLPKEFHIFQGTISIFYVKNGITVQEKTLKQPKKCGLEMNNIEGSAL